MLRTTIMPAAAGALHPLQSSEWLSYYSTKYDPPPQMIVFSDYPSGDSLYALVSFIYRPFYVSAGTPEDEVWWQEDFTWSELRPYLWLKRETTTTGAIDSFMLPQWNPDEVLDIRGGGSGSNIPDTGSYRAKIPTAVANLPLPSNETVYRFWIDPVGEPQLEHYYKEIDTLSAVKTTADTPEDSLFLAYQNWDTLSDTLVSQLLVQFPYDRGLLQRQFRRYYEGMVCDSVQRTGTTLIQVLKSDTLGGWNHPIAGKEGVNQVLVERIESMINDICVEGQKQDYPTIYMAY